MWDPFEWMKIGLSRRGDDGGGVGVGGHPDWSTGAYC